MKALLILVLFATAASVNAQQLTRVEMREAEQELHARGYWTGPIDGRFDPGTEAALIAFQKWTGREINGDLTPAELAAIRTSNSPTPREAGYAHVEVDLDRQLLLVVDATGNVQVLPVSTGNGKDFIDEGQTSVAYTPRGRFVVYEKEIGWQTGSLGATYYANFISGGVAIHGSRNVPAGPASHGCIRVPMFDARSLSKLMPVGTIVLVYDKVSFVSAKDWVKNPKLKEAAMAIAAADDDMPYKRDGAAGSKSIASKKARPKSVRAD
ncbi:MAG TPA: L,D-transpeptidase family protein [Pyrinomonadaceae bacterium]|nr:L,D-transpeptidase family protein [Pyrinomonadaceae bacterium]